MIPLSANGYTVHIVAVCPFYFVITPLKISFHQISHPKGQTSQFNHISLRVDGLVA